MLRQLIDLLFGRRPPAAAAPPPSTLQGRPTEPSAAPEAIMAIGARRPLIDRRGRVAGFEFRMSASTMRRLQAQPDGVAAGAHLQALFAAMRLTVQAGRLAFTELPAAWLPRAALAGDLTGFMVAVGPPPAQGFGAPVLEALEAMRRSQASVGWEFAGGAAGGMAPRPDFLLVRGAEESLAAAVRTGIAVLASDIGSVEALDDALRTGATYACCAIAPGEEPRDAQPIAPQVQRLCQLLNRLVQGADTEPIVADVKADVGLSYRLLHHLNMAGVGGARQIESIEHAVTLLGRNELYRWLSMLLIRFAAGRPASGALQEMALARARLLELLATDRGEPAPGSLFTLGLASMLGILLHVRLADAIEPLSLPAAARQALLAQAGPWHPYLALAEQLEQGEGAGLDALAEPFGGVAVVRRRTVEAWDWAHQAVSVAGDEAPPP